MMASDDGVPEDAEAHLAVVCNNCEAWAQKFNQQVTVNHNRLDDIMRLEGQLVDMGDWKKKHDNVQGKLDAAMDIVVSMESKVADARERISYLEDKCLTAERCINAMVDAEYQRGKLAAEFGVDI